MGVTVFDYFNSVSTSNKAGELRLIKDTALDSLLQNMFNHFPKHVWKISQPKSIKYKEYSMQALQAEESGSVL